MTTGLRERRRAETERAIRAAALRLSLEHGFDHVTIERISAEVGVSTRTFFNYFATKEAALLPGAATLSAEVRADFVARPPAEPAQVLAELLDVLVAELADGAPDRQEMQQLFALAESNSSLHARLLARFDELRVDVVAMVAQRLARSVDDPLPELLAAVAMVTVQTAFARWATSGSSETPVRAAAEAAELLLDVLGGPRG